MDHHKLVLPEHLNPQGFLFGGYLLQWIDEFAYVTALTEFPGQQFVTVALDNVVFKHSIKKGEVIRFEVKQTRVGNTSVAYQIEVYGELLADSPEQVLFATAITFVAVDDSGNKVRIQK